MTQSQHFKYDALIIAAGNGTRMGSTLPKILTEINGKPNLWNTLDKMQHKHIFNNIFIVVNKRSTAQVEKSVSKYTTQFQNFHHNSPSNTTKIHVVEIESGQGDGHAIIQAVDVIGIKNLTDHFFVLWGDAYLTSENIFMDCIRELTQQKNKITAAVIPPSCMIIPVINEKNPYVAFNVDSNMNCIAADFSKYGESHPYGWHDQCVFMICHPIIDDLKLLQSTFLKDSRYITNSGELTFLYLIHYLWNTKRPAKAIVTETRVLSYNTPEEVTAINEELNVSV